MAESSASQEDKSAVLTAGSEVTFDIVCTPCDNDGDIKEAEAYCNECYEYLCKMCHTYHRKVTNTKHHTIVDKKNMPNCASVGDICSERCQIHKEEVIKYYCPAHKTLNCGVCLFRNHDKCKDKVYIPDEAKTFTDSKEFKEFQAVTEKLSKLSENIIKFTQLNMEYLSDNRIKALQELDEFRKEMNNAIDKLKAELEEKTEEITAQHCADVRSIADQARQIQTELKLISKEFNSYLSKKQNCKMFIEMKNKKVKLDDLQKQLEDAGTSCRRTFRFKPNESLRNLLRKKDGMGEILENDPCVTHIADINVRSNGDANRCRITGATLLSENKLVIIDFNNKSVKLIDTELKRIISEYKLEESPRDVTSINCRKVAVSLPYTKEILIMKSEDGLIIDKIINLSQQCWRITCFNNRLFVSFENPQEIKVFDITGKVLQTLSTSSHGEKLFSWAPRMIVGAFTQAIYASGWDEDRVIMMDMDGNVIAQYKDNDLKTPAHCEVDDSRLVYVCGGFSNNIHLLTPYCRKVKVLLTKADGIESPRCVCYCRDTERLFVGMAENDIVKVYQL